MPRYVALEWDNTEVRLLVGRIRTNHVELEHALTLPLTAGEARTPNEIGEAIHDALTKIGAAGLEAIVAVGRANIELRFLTVPPVPPEELPELVRFQASRQFSQAIEEGLIDFAPLASSGQPPTSVLAAAITPDLLKSIRAVCEAAHVTPKHLVLRPFAADSLVTDRLAEKSCVLTVDRLAEEVDLTVVLGGQAVFPRSVRVGNYGSAEDQANTIVGEMKRTIAAAQNQIGGDRVESVLILGNETEQRTLAETITRELSLAVGFVDPLEAVTISPEVQLPSNIGRFAPLVGALVDQSRGRRHEIDFLSPRKRPAPADHRRRYIIAASAAAALVLLMCAYAWWQLGSYESETAATNAEAKKLEEVLKRGKPKVEQARLIDEFAAAQVPWLDELRELSTDLPPGDMVILDKLDVYADRRQMIIEGGAASPQDVPALELTLSDDRHNLRGTGTAIIPQNAPYSASFRETISLLEPDQSPKKKGATAEKPPAKTASKGRKS
jgi:Tfp pilus assembly PilM family ATPase